MEWINQKDQIPEDGINVLAYSTKPSMPECRVEVVWFDHGAEEWAGATSLFLSGITHWMPLPEPPK